MRSHRSPPAGRARHRLPALAALAVAAAATAATALAPPIAVAAPAVSREFDVPGQPGQLALGPDGSTWVVLSSGDADIARITPDGTVTPYRDARLSGAIGISGGPDGRVWITRNGEIVHFSPADPTGTDVAVPIATLSDPRRITSDGTALWTASGDQLYRIATDGTVTPTRVADMVARGTTVGGDGRIWIADGGRDGRVTAVDPSGAEPPAFFPISGPPQEVAAGPGTQIAYTYQLNNPHEIGRITPPGAAQPTPVPGTDPFGIARGLDDAYWIANFTGHDLTRMTADGTITRLGGFTPLSGPRWIAAGAGGTLWVSLELMRRVALVTGLEAPRADPPRADPPRGEPIDAVAPVLGGLAVAGRPRAGARAVRVGYRLSEPATIVARLSRKSAGKQRAGRCVSPTRRLRRARACARWVQRGAVTVSGAPAGAGAIVVRPRRGRLAAGTYRVELRATDAAGNRGAAQKLTIVVRAAQKRR
jgi:hypothetical protein